MKDIIHAADLPPVVPRLRVEHRGRDPHSLISPSLGRTNCRVRARVLQKYAQLPTRLRPFLRSLPHRILNVRGSTPSPYFSDEVRGAIRHITVYFSCICDCLPLSPARSS